MKLFFGRICQIFVTSFMRWKLLRQPDNVSSKLISSLGELGSNLFLYTDLQIKDDKIIMYGFATFKDQNFFKLLQSVQGVGPKAALSILSTLNVDEIILFLLLVLA